MRQLATALSLLLAASTATAGELHLDVVAGYAGTADLGFEDELAPVLGLGVEWSPDNRWSLDASLLARYADKLGAADSVQTTLLLRGCWTTRRDAGLRLCAGSWSSSLATESWEKVGAGAMGSVGYGWDLDGEWRLWTDVAHTPSTNVEPEVSGTKLTVRLQARRWGYELWAQRVHGRAVDGVESGVALTRRILE